VPKSQIQLGDVGVRRRRAAPAERHGDRVRLPEVEHVELDDRAAAGGPPHPLGLGHDLANLLDA
jgi:hypothetical protein